MGAQKAEPLGPSSRRTPLVISEIMYAPAPRSDGRILEHVEIYNSQPWFADLGGFRLAGDVQFVFPEGTRLAAHAFLVVARAPADLQAVYPISNVLGPYSGGLAGTSGKLRLEHRSGAVLLDIDYGSQSPWPVAPDGTGHSLVLARPSFGERDPHAWSASSLVGGSPGGPEPAVDDPLRAVVINEVSANPRGAAARFVELYNHSRIELALDGCALSDDPAKAGFVIPGGTSIGAGGFVAFYEGHLGFSFSGAGGRVFLAAPDRTAVLDAVRYGAQAAGLPEGRWPSGGHEWRALARPTPGAANAEFFIHDVVINEIMYHPISGAKEDEYVELFNRGTEAVDLSGWRFVDGINFTFPSGASLPAGGYLVVAKDAARLRSIYPHLTAANALGDYDGSLADSGERVALARPESVLAPDGQGGMKSIVVEVGVDEVTYGTGGRWGQWADGGGSSLELIHPRTDHRQAANWTDSDESGKGEWTTIEFTGLVDNYLSASVSDRLNVLQVLLLGAGECLLDDVTALRVGELNLVTNPAFEAGLSSWIGRGSHSYVQLGPSSGEGGSSLRLRSTGRGDPVANHLQGLRAAAVRKGEMATLRARARWQHGTPEILLRVPGNYLEAYGRMKVPANLGTPGLPNSRATAAVGPAIAAVTHWPTLPRTNQPVVVTALVQAPTEPTEAVLNYRLDPSTELLAVPMRDDGAGDDTVAGDRLYTATIPAQSSPRLIAFHIVASQAGPTGAKRAFPDDAPVGECLVRVGEPVPAGAFGVYHLWMTDAARRHWAKREPLSNDPLPATFVNGEHRVIYGAGAMYSGSVYHASFWSGPVGGPCDYALTFPDDNHFLGGAATTVSWPGLFEAPDTVAQTEQLAYWLAEQLGLPFNYRRYAIVYFNGQRRNAVMEDTQQPDRDFLRQWYPGDSEGDLYKLQIFYDLNRQWLAAGSLQDFAIPDSRQKLARYRWNWGKRSARGAMNDYRSFLELVHSVNRPANEGYSEQIERLIDLDQWARTMAVERVFGNWDSYGYANGQNMYFYKPTAGRWQLLIWDVDFQLGGPVADPTTRDLFTHANLIFPDTPPDPTTERLFKHPPFRRAYLRALQTAVTGPLTRANELIDAKAAAFAANGVALAPATGIKTYLNNRRKYILGRLDLFRPPFAITSPTGDGLRSDQALVTLQGTASFEIDSLRINGLGYAPEWTTATNWSVIVPLRGPNTEFVVTGLDAPGQPVAGAAQSLTINYTGTEPLAPDRVVINEWMASNTAALADPADGDFDDWFEIYNPNPFPVDLSGYQLADDPTAIVRSVIGTGVSIAPWGFRLVWADRELAQNGPSADLHVGFNLARSGDAIVLLDPAGHVVDQVQFGSQTTDASQGRWPDGFAEPFRFMSRPTPGAPNEVTGATAPLRIVELKLAAPGLATLTWSAELGARYQVRSADQLGAGDWPIAAEVIAAGPTATATLAPGTAKERYFRVEGPP